MDFLRTDGLYQGHGSPMLEILRTLSAHVQSLDGGVAPWKAHFKNHQDLDMYSIGVPNAWLCVL